MAVNPDNHASMVALTRRYLAVLHPSPGEPSHLYPRGHVHTTTSHPVGHARVATGASHLHPPTTGDDTTPRGLGRQGTADQRATHGTASETTARVARLRPASATTWTTTASHDGYRLRRWRAVLLARLPTLPLPALAWRLNRARAACCFFVAIGSPFVSDQWTTSATARHLRSRPVHGRGNGAHAIRAVTGRGELTGCLGKVLRFAFRAAHRHDDVMGTADSIGARLWSRRLTCTALDASGHGGPRPRWRVRCSSRSS